MPLQVDLRKKNEKNFSILYLIFILMAMLKHPADKTVDMCDLYKKKL